jgi:hypothetical protein
MGVAGADTRQSKERRSDGLLERALTREDERGKKRGAWR